MRLVCSTSLLDSFARLASLSNCALRSLSSAAWRCSLSLAPSAQSSLTDCSRFEASSSSRLERSCKKNQILRYGEKGCATYGRNGCLRGEIKYLEVLRHFAAVEHERLRELPALLARERALLAAELALGGELGEHRLLRVDERLVEPLRLQMPLRF